MIVILMGVSGSGKTTVGRLLADQLGWPYFDADDFHSPENIEKMSLGLPLDDHDRTVWLDSIASKMVALEQRGDSVVLTCSCLKRAYRQRLRREKADLMYVYLRGEFELIKQRIKARTDHFFRAELLRSQFNDLEEPRQALVVDVQEPPEVLVRRIRSALLPDIEANGS